MRMVNQWLLKFKKNNMKTRIILALMIIVLSLFSCFEDQGNYDYIEVKVPVFTKNSYAIDIKLGDTVNMSIPFVFPYADSLEILENCEYEWSIEGVTLCTDKEIHMTCDSILKKLGLEEPPKEPQNGYFSITDKRTDMKHATKLCVMVSDKYKAGTWRILSEDGGNAKLSFQMYKYEGKDSDGDYIFTYQNLPAIFKESNGGEVIPGNPKKIIDYIGKHINAKFGASTIITDQVNWEMDNQLFTIAHDLGSQFLGAAPSNLKPIDIYTNGQYSYILNEDGKIYTRTMSSSYLGGKYLDMPYVVDDKGYKAKMFATPNNSSSINLIYDEKNHRLLGVDMAHKISPILKSPGEYDFDITNMPEDIEVLSISRNINFFSTSFSKYTADLCMIVYNKDGATYVSEFTIERGSATKPMKLSNQEARTYQFPVKLEAGDLIWAPSWYNTFYTGTVNARLKYPIYFTKGNSFKYYNRETQTVNDLYNFNSKITAADFDSYYTSYRTVGIGLENGDFMIIDLRKGGAEIIPTSKFNVGGKIVDVSLMKGNDNK